MDARGEVQLRRVALWRGPMLPRFQVSHETPGISPPDFRCSFRASCLPNMLTGKEGGQLFNLRIALGNTVAEYPGHYKRRLLSIGGE